MQPLSNAFHHPAVFARQADELLRAAGRSGDVHAAFGAVEQALEQSFEMALHAALQPVARPAPRAAATPAAVGPVAGASLPSVPAQPWAALQPVAAADSLVPPVVPPPVASGDRTGAGLEPWREAIAQVSARHGVPAWLVTNVVRQESGGNAQATSPAGAMGLMQLMPGTAAELGVEAPYDPMQNLEGGVRYLARMITMFDGDLTRAVAAYNAGPGAVARHGGVPPYRETQDYVRRVLGETLNGNG
jgi:soluble lytic murein transglycosylase-like protein